MILGGEAYIPPPLVKACLGEAGFNGIKRIDKRRYNIGYVLQYFRRLKEALKNTIMNKYIF